MMNSCALRELIAFEVKRRQEACEGQHECVRWLAKNKHLKTHAIIHTVHTYMHACTGTLLWITKHIIQNTNMV